MMSEGRSKPNQGQLTALARFLRCLGSPITGERSPLPADHAILANFSVTEFASAARA